MAGSPSHRWGQIIGEVFEATVLPLLTDFADKHHVYLDQHGERHCRKGRKCTWTDSKGNAHDLDFVLEQGGGPDKIGKPVAFIEVAWRRYTKHSRNKAQEIQGAIIPLAETYGRFAPFKGAILAGVFTAGALAQLQSLGFTILYFSYDMIVAAFKSVGIDASFDENTPDAVCQRKVDRYERLSVKRRTALAAELTRLNARQVDNFACALAVAISRRIDRIIVLPLHGTTAELSDLEEAIAFIKDYNACGKHIPIQRYEIQIRYSNGDRIECGFADRNKAIAFLESYGGK